MKRFVRVIIFLVCLWGGLVKSQSTDTVVLYTGRTVCVSNLKLESEDSKFYFVDDKGKARNISAEDVYEVRNTTTQCYYVPDSTTDALTCEEMHYYMQGQVDARKQYKARGALLGGVAVGVAVPVVLVASGLPFLLSPVLPIAYTVIQAKVEPRLQTFNIDAEKSSNERYTQGFRSYIIKRRVNQSLIGGGVGLASCLLVFVLL